MEGIVDTRFQTYYRNHYAEYMPKGSESQSPNLFHGLSISSSPLEKINDLIKNKIRCVMNPVPIVSVLDNLAKRLDEHDVKI